MPRRSEKLWLGLAIAACVVTRAPSFRAGPLSDDEAIYGTMAKEILAGGVMYRDVVDHKPPGLTYTYAFVEALAGRLGPFVGVHLLGLLAVVGTCLALSAIARRLLPEQLAVWPALLYALASAAQQPVDALAVNGELLMNFPCALALCLALRRADGLRRHAGDLLTGILIGIAALYKYQALALGVALVFLQTGRSPWRLVLWTAGAALPALGAGLYFAHRGALADALFWGVSFNRQYVANGPSFGFALQRFAVKIVAVILPAGLLYGGAIATLPSLVRGHGPIAPLRERWFLLALTVGAAACVAIGGRYFGHYFLQLELPLALLAPTIVDGLFLRRPGLTAALLAGPPLLFSAVAASPALARRLFDPDAPDYATIAAGVTARTNADDTIWVWGNAPMIYALAGRRSGTRFVFCNYQTGLSPATPSEYDPRIDPAAAVVPGAMDLALRDLAKRRPKIVLDTAAAALKGYARFQISKFPTLERYLLANYRRDGDAGGVPVYRLAQSVPLDP